MNVLSLFDGMSCGQIALERAGIKVDNYFASEIDKYAIKITQKNYPNTIQLGDIQNWKDWNLPKIDLILAGSPCQGFSNAGKGLNFNDTRSKLFFIFVDIKNKFNPDNWLLENVKMKREWQDIISNHVKSEPIKINSSLVSAQNRIRLYWTNWKITQPEDKNILLADIITDVDDFWWVYSRKNYKIPKKNQYKSGTLAGAGGHAGGNTSDMDILIIGEHTIIPTSKSGRILLNKSKNVRRLTPIECERLQTVPDNYTEGVSNTQRYKMLSNGWTVDVIAHILSCL